MYSDIIRKLNQQNTLDSMVPLTEFSDKGRAEELEKQGYIPSFTAETWEAAFPDVNPKHILCPQMVLFPPSLIYYDPEHYICFDTHIYGGEMKFPLYTAEEGHTDANQLLLGRIKVGMRDYEERDYLRLLLPFSTEECGGIAIRILRDMLEREDPNPKLYAAFLSVYTLCNTGAHLLGDKALGRLAMCKSEKQKQETARKLMQFPGNTVTVYRGQASQSTPFEKACSWTTDINKAYFFASWRSAEDSRILTGMVRKDMILDFIDDRNEKEILVLPGVVEKTGERQCATWEMFQNIAAADMFSRNYRFPKESLARNIMAALDAVYDNAGADDHDKSHSLRVALLANYIYRLDVLMPLRHRNKEDFKMASQLLADLSTAIVYHDAGRKDNTANTEHGAAGYEIYRQGRGENKVIRFLTTFHCRSDEDAKQYWNMNFEGKTAEFIWKAFSILKDADALDRVRFGNLSRDYLDVNTLRTETAKSLVPVAHRLVRAKIR